jgi:hypothetical protein
MTITIDSMRCNCARARGGHLIIGYRADKKPGPTIL